MFLLLFPLAVVAQSPDYQLYFQSEIVNPAPVAFDRAELEGALYNHHYHVLVQFEQPQNLENWVKKGLKLEAYIPSLAYFIQVPETLEASFFASPGIRGVYAIRQEWKIQRDILQQNPPYWAVLGNGLLEVQLSFFSSIDVTDLSLVRSLFNDRLMNIMPSPYPQTIKAVIQQEDVLWIASFPFVQYIAPADAPAEPDNYRARTDHRSNFISTDYAGGLNYNGAGIRIMMNDDGSIGPHIDYKGRLNQSYVGASIGNHGDHVAGIIMGTGNLNPTAKGQAWGADLWVYDYPNGLYDFPSAYVDDSLLITSSSYSDGCNQGYTSFAQLIDQTTRNHRSLIHVFSSGNNGTSDCSYGAGSNWGNITGGHKAGKNCITVGNVNNVDAIAASSSRGPVHDGRIKPEVVAVGSSVTSTVEGNLYDTYSGTSMACPAVSGTLGQLYQVYKENNGGNLPPSALIKGILMNTADDLGNAGPDFIYGYGRINARRAYETIVENRYFTDSVNTGGNKSFNIQVPANARELRVMVYWHDPAAAPNSGIALVNNLNMTVTDPSSNSWNPWILDHTPNAGNLNAVATRGIDNRNNSEQVTLISPAAGTYTVNVNGFAVNGGTFQEFFVVYEVLMTEITMTYPIGGEGFTQNETIRTRWDYSGAPGSFTLQYSVDEGLNWTNISTSIGSGTRYYDWTAPAIIDGQVKMKIIRGGVSDESDTSFSIINIPGNLGFDTICGSKVTLKWNAVPGATGYEVYKLGQKYMESQGTTANLNFTMNNVNTLVENWFSVRALGPDNAKGRRAVAVILPSGPINCTLLTEAAVSSIVEPVGPSIMSCFASPNQQVTITLVNNGQNAVSNFPVQFSLNGVPSPVETFVGTIAGSGGTATYTFNQTINLSIPGNYILKAWFDIIGDQNVFNDTLTQVFVVTNSVPLVPPFTENFESFNLCNTSANCGLISCNMANGWLNLANGTEDDIDWRTNEGSTPSANTGPAQDYNPGTPTGNYLYLEASTCFSNEAILLSPCIDLSSGGGETLRFAYHMNGADMGALHVDIFYNGSWVNDIMPPLSGNQGPNWNIAIVDLSVYHGGFVQLRFRGITGPDYRSDMAIDDISIENISAGLSASSVSGFYCVGDAVTFTDNSFGSIDTYSWNFGPGANPPTATGQGPHIVTYNTSGAKSPSLTVSNNMGSDTETLNLTIDSLPNANFATAVFGNQVNFTNNSTGGISYAWNFGDGNTSTLTFPIHNYGSGGTYTVTLIVTNHCGTDTAVNTVTIQSTSVNEIPGMAISVFPNPTKGLVTVQWGNSPVTFMKLMDMTGRIIKVWEVNQEGFEMSIDISGFAAGKYILEVDAQKFPLIKW